MSGTALKFLEEARAALVAIVLKDKGFGVTWKHDAPNIVMTQASKSQVREICDNRKGVIEDWFELPEIDCGGTDDEKTSL